MGSWTLKPKEELDSWRCLEARLDNVEDFITFDSIRELTYEDKEDIFESIKQGYVEGQINDSYKGFEEDKLKQEGII